MDHESIGWFAPGFMKSDTGIFLNAVLGVIGAAVVRFLFGLPGARSEASSAIWSPEPSAHAS